MFCGEGSDLVRQAQRGEPRQPRPAVVGADDVADGAERERAAEHGPADAPSGRGALGELGHHRSDGGEGAPDRGQLQPGRERPCRGKTLRDLPASGEQRQHQVAGQCQGQRRGQAGVSTGHGGPEQLASTGLLVGAGVT